jgi:hypothetical protein
VWPCDGNIIYCRRYETNDRLYVPPPVWNRIPANSCIYWISKDLSNIGIGYHAFYTDPLSSEVPPHPVYWHDGHWQHLYFDDQRLFIKGTFDALDKLDTLDSKGKRSYKPGNISVVNKLDVFVPKPPASEIDIAPSPEAPSDSTISIQEDTTIDSQIKNLPINFTHDVMATMVQTRTDTTQQPVDQGPPPPDNSQPPAPVESSAALLACALRRTPHSARQGQMEEDPPGDHPRPRLRQRQPPLPLPTLPLNPPQNVDNNLLTMGQLPPVFHGDRARADDFIEKLKAYF